MAPCCIDTVYCGEENRGICSNIEKPCNGGTYLSVKALSCFSSDAKLKGFYRAHTDCPYNGEDIGREVGCCCPNLASYKSETEGEYNVADAGGEKDSIVDNAPVQDDQIANIGTGGIGSAEEDYGALNSVDVDEEQAFFNT